MSFSNVQPTIFREYIGAKPNPPFWHFPEIINPRVIEFHFILAFATDETGTGKFVLSPNLAFINAEIIKNLKNNNRNAKVVISIGGRFKIAEPERERWLHNAEGSLQIIIDRFRDSRGNNLIDGIDVNYESITANENDFARYIGGLIRILREDSYVQVVSIAPSAFLRRHYIALFQRFNQDIDWVDYRFYEQGLPNQDAFVNLYHELLNDYPNEKLLAGFSTDPSNAGNISLGDFLGGCGRFLKDKSLPGIFVWNANDSAVEPNPFHVERLLQVLLVDFN